MAELTITQQNFEQEVLLAKEPGKVKVGKVNVDDERELALEYGVSSIPTVMVFQNGEVKETSVGYRPKEEIEQLLK